MRRLLSCLLAFLPVITNSQQIPGVVDIDACFAAMVDADVNDDGRIPDEEYVSLAQALSPPGLIEVNIPFAQLPFSLKSTFRSLACLCQDPSFGGDENDIDCCSGQNAHIRVTENPEIASATDMTYLFAVCSLVEGAAERVLSSPSPTLGPTTLGPTGEPTIAASIEPTNVASTRPTLAASNIPTSLVSEVPTSSPVEPVSSDEPTIVASVDPTIVASVEPTIGASDEPTNVASNEPTSVASNVPTSVVSAVPPTSSPFKAPTNLRPNRPPSAVAEKKSSKKKVKSPKKARKKTSSGKKRKKDKLKRKSRKKSSSSSKSRRV